MKNLIPQFITEKISQGETGGTFAAFTMFIDISGFTNITERLKEEGKEGIEVLMDILDKVFEPGINLIYAAGGFVSTFAGDAFMAIFPEQPRAIDILACAWEINAAFQANSRHKYQENVFEIFVKQGLSYGKVDWGIVGTGEHKAFYFKGEAINACCLAEQQCASMDVSYDAAFANMLSDFDRQTIEFANMDTEYYRLLSCSSSVHPTHPPVQAEPSLEILSHFLPDRILQTQVRGEFRDIVSVFIAFPESDDKVQFEEVLSSIIDLGDSYGGYIENINFGDKGAHSLVIFGVPKSYENDVQRALSFALQLKKALSQQIRIGITKGMVFAGFKGCQWRLSYGVLGSIVNLSARMMMAAEPGSIFTDSLISSHPQFRFQTKGLLAYKGFREPVATYELLDKAAPAQIWFSEKLRGRETELSILQDRLKPLLDGEFAGLTMVYGEAGIGKSHLVSEFCDRNKDLLQTIILPCDSIIKAGFNPFKHALKSIFSLDDDLSPEAKEATFSAKYDKLLLRIASLPNEAVNEAVGQELSRLRSILAAQVDISYPDSLYESLSPSERYKNTLYGYKELIKALSLIHPVLLWVDDFQHLDKASLATLDILFANTKSFPIMMLATARNQSETFLSDTISQSKQPDIVLSSMDNDVAKSLIESHLNAIAAPALLNLILQKSVNNPFYIEQIIRYLQEAKLLIHSGDTVNFGNQDFEIPESLNSILVARIDQLDLEVKNMIQLASVFGREVELSLLLIMVNLYEEKITGIDRQPIFDRIEGEQLWQKLSELRYIFKHALLHEAIYAMQLKSRLRELHYLAATAYAQIYPDNPQKQYEMAGHYAKAGRMELALPHYEKAGLWFKSNYINDKALECFSYVLEHGRDTYPAKNIFDSWANKGMILKLTGKAKAAKACYQEAVALAARLQDKPLLIGGYHLLASLADDSEAEFSPLNLLQKARELALELDDKSLLSANNGGLGVYYAMRGDISQSMLYLQLQKELATELGDDRSRAYAAGNIGNMLESMGQIDEAVASFQELLNYATEAKDKRGVGAASNNLGVLYKNMGDFPKALEQHLTQLKIAIEIGDKNTIALCWGNIGSIYRDMGKFAEALESYHKRWEMGQEIGSAKDIMHANGGLGQVYFETQEYDLAVHYFQLQYQLALEGNDDEDLGIALDNMARVMRTKGRLDDALEYAKQALEIAIRGEDIHSISISWGSVGRVYQLMEKHDEAIICSQKQLQLARDSQSKFGIAVASYNIAKSLYMLSKYDEASPYITEAIQIGEELNLNYLSEFLELQKEMQARGL